MLTLRELADPVMDKEASMNDHGLRFYAKGEVSKGWRIDLIDGSGDDGNSNQDVYIGQKHWSVSAVSVLQSRRVAGRDAPCYIF